MSTSLLTPSREQKIRRFYHFHPRAWVIQQLIVKANMRALTAKPFLRCEEGSSALPQFRQRPRAHWIPETTSVVFQDTFLECSYPGITHSTQGGEMTVCLLTVSLIPTTKCNTPGVRYPAECQLPASQKRLYYQLRPFFFGDDVHTRAKLGYVALHWDDKCKGAFTPLRWAPALISYSRRPVLSRTRGL